MYQARLRHSSGSAIGRCRSRTVPPAGQASVPRSVRYQAGPAIAAATTRTPPMNGARSMAYSVMPSANTAPIRNPMTNPRSSLPSALIGVPPSLVPCMASAVDRRLAAPRRNERSTSTSTCSALRQERANGALRSRPHPPHSFLPLSLL